MLFDLKFLTKGNLWQPLEANFLKIWSQEEFEAWTQNQNVSQVLLINLSYLLL